MDMKTKDCKTPMLWPFSRCIKGTDYYFSGFECEACGKAGAIGGTFGLETVCYLWDYRPICGAKVNRTVEDAAPLREGGMEQ